MWYYEEMSRQTDFDNSFDIRVYKIIRCSTGLTAKFSLGIWGYWHVQRCVVYLICPFQNAEFAFRSG